MASRGQHSLVTLSETHHWPGGGVKGEGCQAGSHTVFLGAWAGASKIEGVPSEREPSAACRLWTLQWVFKDGCWLCHLADLMPCPKPRRLLCLCPYSHPPCAHPSFAEPAPTLGENTPTHTQIHHYGALRLTNTTTLPPPAGCLRRVLWGQPLVAPRLPPARRVACPPTENWHHWLQTWGSQNSSTGGAGEFRQQGIACQPANPRLPKLACYPCGGKHGRV